MSVQGEAALKVPMTDRPAPSRWLWQRPPLVAGELIAVAIGVAAFLYAIAGPDAQRAWEAVLVNLLFFLGIAQGAVVVSCSFYLTQARWGGAAAYRLAESFSAFIPLGFILFWLLILGRAQLFPWLRHPIEQKAIWLNTPFLFARDGAGLLLMTVLSWMFVRASRSDAGIAWAENSAGIEMPPKSIRRLAPTVAISYAAVYTLLAFDLIMSLAPMWRSTLFGAFFFAGAYWSGLCAMAAIGIALGSLIGGHNRLIAGGFLHDTGKLIFAFSIFWVYLFWSQYLPIWYADLPVETFFVVQRINYPPWAALSWTVLFLVWVIPFVTLMGVKPKRTPSILFTVAALGLLGIWLQNYVLVVPSLSLKIVPLGWIEILITIGFAGAFGLCAAGGLTRLAETARPINEDKR